MSKKLTANDGCEFSQFFMKNEDENIVCTLLKCLTIDSSDLFTRNEMYKEAVDLLSSVLIKTSTTVNSNVVPRLLVKNLLQCDNMSMGYMLIDLWSAWIRCNFCLNFLLDLKNSFFNFSCLSDVQCFDLILFWSEMNQKLVQSNHLRSIHVKILLRHLYDSLTDSHKLKLRENKPILSNIKLWTALGLHRITDGTSEIMDLNIEIDALCKTFLAERSDSVLNKLVSLVDAPNGTGLARLRQNVDGSWI